MTAKPHKPPTKKRSKHGEDFLCAVEKLTLVLDNGQQAVFDIEGETSDYPAGYPARPSDVQRFAQKAVERYAFWAYQAERLLALVRVQESAATRTRAVSDGEVRNQSAKQAKCGQIPYVSEALIEAAINLLPDVVTAEGALSELRRQYGIVRAIRDTVEHRLYVLRAMLRFEAKPNKGA